MKVNKKFIRGITSICAAVTVLVSCLLFPVLAVDSNGNEFIDMHEYATYTFPENDSEVYVDCYFPTDWYSTAVYTKSFSGSHYVGTFNGSPIKFDTQYPGIQITMRPIGGSNMFTGSTAGKQVQNAHIIDLTVVPKNSWYHSSFSVSAYLGEADTPAENMFFGYQVLYFVDKNGVVVHRSTLFTEPSVYIDQYGIYHFSYAFTTDLAKYELPDSVVGLVCVYTLEDAQQSVNYYVKEVSYTKFRFSYNLSALQYESQQNERLQGTMDRIEDALTNGTPEQNQQAQDAVAGLNSSTDKLGQLGDTMSSVEKPSIDSSQISAGSLVPSTSLVVLSSPFQALWENKQLLAMLTIVVTLVLVSWVFFGKKG